MTKRMDVTDARATARDAKKQADAAFYEGELERQWVPDGSHSQVARVAKRFCLVAVAGELATANGLTGWTQGEAVEAARRCFEGWLELRGGTGNSDEAEAVRQVQHFLAAHGDNRFRVDEDRRQGTDEAGRADAA